MNYSKIHLFAGPDLDQVLRNEYQKMIKEVDAINDDQLLSTSVDDMVSYLEEKYRVDPIILDEENITVGQNEQEIQVRDFGREFTTKGTLNKFYIPYSGDKALFECKASTRAFAYAMAVLLDTEIIFLFESNNNDVEKIKTDFERELALVKKNIGWVNSDVETFNVTLQGKAEEIVTKRREKILANKNLVSSLGFPMRRRGDIPKTYASPKVRRKQPAILPSASTTPFNPEPAIGENEYKHILFVIDNMVSVMERSPQAFKSMGEEDLRQHFLVQLNGHYEGKATGETFNFKGKTDILIRDKDKNIFIGECKFWKGPKSFIEAIDQILGYTSWRDTKAALLIFNRNKSLSNILNKIPCLLQDHPNFKRLLEYDRETGWQAILHHNDDKNRELTLTIHVYEIPG